MIIINEEDYNKSNVDNSYYLTLDATNKKKYLINYSYYYNYLIQFISRIIEIKRLDQIMQKSKNNYKRVSEDEMDIYQYLNSPFFHYFYIRNNLSIERLTESELKELETLINKNGENYNDEIELFIQKTFVKVITENINEQPTTQINYGPFDLKYMAPNSSIVLGMRYEDDNDYTNDNYIELKNSRETEIDFLTSLIRIKYTPIIKEKLGLDFAIIEYNSESIKKMNK